MPQGYIPKLLPEEVEPDGLFFALHRWLDVNAEDYGFFRPYRRYQGGMYPEPWHLSYAPLAMSALSQVTIELLTTVIERVEILGKALVLERLPVIYRDHICNIVPPENR